MKRKRSGESRDRRMKKALAGPAKPAAKKKPERRAMIAAVRRRIDLVVWWTTKQTRRADRAANQRIERAYPLVAREGRRLRKWWKTWSAKVGRRLRPLGARFFRGLAASEKAVRRVARGCARAATRASAVITPERALGAVVFGAAACLIVSQFLDYRAVEIGQPGYVGLPDVAPPPVVDVETAGAAHAYLLIPLALAAAVLGLAATNRKRRRLGGVVFALGLACLAIVLLVDLPNGLDAGSQTSRFSGATAVLYDAFYAELVASATIALGGLALLVSRQPAPRRSTRPRHSRSHRPSRRGSEPGSGSLAESHT
jgi:hypothetical protein